jgi:peroxiredoxin
MKRTLFALIAVAALSFSVGIARAQDDKPAEKAKDAPKDAPADKDPAKEEPKADKPAEPAAEEKAPEFATIDKKAPEFTLKDANGKEQKLSSYAGKIVVLEWVNYDCPFVKRHYAGENMQKLQKEVRDAGGVWLSICSSTNGKEGHFEGEALLNRIKKEKADAGFYLVDSDSKVGRTYKAQTTPHMYVIDAKGVLRYQGAIDDNRRAKNAEEIAKSKNYVRDAFNALKDGKEVATKETKPYGCDTASKMAAAS